MVNTIIAVLVGVVFDAGVAPADEAAVEVLKRCLEHQRSLQHVEMRVVSTSSYPTAAEGGGQSFISGAESTVRRDGGRLDITARVHWGGDRQSKLDDLRTVILDDRMLNYQVDAGADRSRGIMSDRTDAFRFLWLGYPLYGLVLDGYIYGMGNRSLCEVMLSGEAKLRAREAVGGVDCQVIEADTDYGDIRLWIEIESGAVMQFLVEKQPDDLTQTSSLEVEPLSAYSPFRDAHVASWSARLDQVKLDTVSGRRIASAGTLTEEYVSSKGDANLSVTKIERAEFEFEPEWTSNPGAFQMDFAEGAGITDLDQPDSGVRLVWHNGAVALADADFDPQVAIDGGSSRAAMVLLLAVMIAVLGLTILVLWRAGRAKTR